MGIPPLPDELLHETVAALERAGGNRAAAARDLDIPVTTLKHRLGIAAKRGLFGVPAPVPEGFEVARHAYQYDAEGNIRGQSLHTRQAPGDAFAVPDGHRVKGYSTLVDGDGRTVQQWVKTREGELDPVWVAERIKEEFADARFEVPHIVPPDATNDACLNLFKFPDAHMGLYVWKDEADENWDLKKAARVYQDGFASLVAMTPASRTAVLLVGGDQTHADNRDNRTERSGHSLDVDGRYERVLYVTCELDAAFIFLLLQTHDQVIVRILKGNHDPHVAIAVTYFLLALFKDEPRVVIDVSPSLFWVYQHGAVMLAATHGHEARPQQMPAIMAARWPQIWGATRFRYGHTFHVHHKSKFLHEDGGAIIETHHSPAPQDAWNYGQGFTSGRSLSSIVYHREFGEYGRFTQPVLPEREDAA